MGEDTFHEYAPLRDPLETHAENLTPEQLVRLRRLNSRLMTIEQQLAKEIQPQLDALNTRLASSSDWLHDYECEGEVTFSIGEADPDYDADHSENWLVKLPLYFSKTKNVEQVLMIDGSNWNEFRNRDGHPMQSERHCYLYHCLYDHTNIGWSNILRIENIWIDIRYSCQHREAVA